MDPDDEYRQAGRQLKKSGSENPPALGGGRPTRPSAAGRMPTDASVGGRPSPPTSAGRVPVEPSIPTPARVPSGRRGGEAAGGKPAKKGLLGVLAGMKGGHGGGHGGGQEGDSEGVRVGPWARMGGRSGPKGGTKLRREDDDDSLDEDDSDVEVMSISSDEEEARKKKNYKPGGDGSAPSHVASVPPGGKPTLSKSSVMTTRRVLLERTLEDDEEDEEAMEWEDVNQEHMRRRVRKLRVNSDLLSLAAGPTNAHKAASALNVSIAAMMQLVDPLGLGPIDTEKLCLVSRVGTATAPPKNLRPEMVVNMEESFEPAVYLSRVHGDTPAGDLVAGRDRVEEMLGMEAKVMQQLVKFHFESFLACRATILDIERNQESMRQEGTIEYLMSAISQVDKKAQKAYGDLLDRQGGVDKIRSVQGLLLRFRTLFNLPGVVRALAKEKDYEGAVHEYLKARSINIPGHSKILKRVQAEVERVVTEISQVLYDQMTDPKADNASVESAMWLLMRLDPKCDPVWDYLCDKEQRIRGMLQGCVAEHEGRLAAVRRRHLERRAEAQRWSQLQEETRQILQKAAVDLSGVMAPEEETQGVPLELDPEQSAALYASLVKRLTSVLVHQLPLFWRTNAMIFSGKLANFPDPNANVLLTSKHRNLARLSSRLSQMSVSSRGSLRGKDKGGPYKKRSQMDALVLAMGIVGLYEAKVTEAFARLEDLKGSVWHMRVAVGEVGRACSVIGASPPESGPLPAVQVLQNLKVDLTSRFVQHVRGLMREASSALAAEEDWVPAPATVHPAGMPRYDISMFPVRFQATMSSCLENVNKVLGQLRGDRPHDPRGHDSLLLTERGLFDAVKLTFYEAFLDASEAFGKLAHELQQEGGPDADALEGLGGRGEGEDEEGEGRQRGERDGEGGAGAGEAEESPVIPRFEGLRSGVAVRTQSQRLLMLLSNAGFMRSVVALQLVQKFHYLWGDSRTPGHALGGAMLSEEARRLLDDIEGDYGRVETELCDQYIAVKAAHLGTPVIRYFLDGTTWSAAPPVKGLRDSALDLILPLVAVHAEVYAGCSPLTETVIRTLAEGLMDALHQVAFQHPVVDLKLLDPNAFCQLSLELSYFEMILAPFSSGALIGITSRLRQMLLERTMDSLAAKARQGGGGQGDEGGGPGGRGARGRGGRAAEEYYASEERDAPTPHNEDHLKSIAENLTNDLLPQELRRTRLNVLCFGGSTIDQYLEGMDASMGGPGAGAGGGLASSVDSLPSQGHGGMGLGMDRTLGGPMGSSNSMLGLERIASVSSTSSGSSAQRSGGGALGGAFSTSTGDVPGGVSAMTMGGLPQGGGAHGMPIGAGGGGASYGAAPSGPFLTPGSYGTGLPASRSARGMPGGMPGGIPAGAGGMPPQGGPYGGGGGYVAGPGYAMGVPEGAGYGMPGGVPPGGAYGPGVGAAQGPPSRLYGSMPLPPGSEPQQLPENYRMAPGQGMQASSAVPGARARARQAMAAAAAAVEGGEMGPGPGVQPEGAPAAYVPSASRARASRHALSSSAEGLDSAPSEAGSEGVPAAYPASRSRGARREAPAAAGAAAGGGMGGVSTSADGMDMAAPPADIAAVYPTSRSRATRAAAAAGGGGMEPEGQEYGVGEGPPVARRYPRRENN